MRWPSSPNDPHGLKVMVAYGVSAVKDGTHDGLAFKVFNEDEANQVHELMKQHPEIPYSLTYNRFDHLKEREIA